MKTRIYLVRHGETLWNAGGKFQGHTDVPLSDNGRQQAKELSEHMQGHKIDAFYSSDLSRAKETAEIIAVPHGLTVNYVPELREINFGLWEGLTYKEITDSFGEISRLWWSSPLTTEIPSGENLQAVVERCNKAMGEIVSRHAGETVVIAVHGGVIRVIVGSILGMDLNHFWKLRLDNVSLTILEYHGPEKGILELYNDTCHLRKPLI
ncbi:alpha-ribazole phosphatase [Desulforamulus aeronauticus]|uniref:Alpha-ribazole phosphatase n=1 Tax=Desulforamulus aeronauticus DSM 10349 TaxID=1121421 RepID=A0A1M6URE5_9FIRM|nr:alpha-ribazole phosphatase [Desulforamulus aeronauticus]SHK71765.1 phosphoglycerate mutase [Desulforamulus aeronauticus DSM 10349]